MLNILFALDDSEKSERLIKFFKESKDIDFVDVCHDGTSASYKLGENKYQAVIIDLLLPGYDGFYLLNKYAKTGRSAEIYRYQRDQPRRIYQ